MTAGESTDVSGYTCDECGGFVPAGHWHVCPEVEPEPVYEFTLSAEPGVRIAAALERIASALELMASG